MSLMTDNKWIIGGGLLAIAAPCGAYVYEKLTKGTKYKEYDQDIIASSIEVKDILQGGYKDREYMPFRYPYHQTMALVKLDMNHWGVMDHEYHRFLTEKRETFFNYDVEKLQDSVLYKKMTDGKCNEVFYEFRDFVVNHYTHRFPNLFSRRGNVVYNHIMDEEYDMDNMDPFLVVTRIAMEDFYVCLKNEELEQLQCIGVSVAFGGGGFPITPLVGDTMDAIHKPVPYYEEKLKKSMNRWFDKFTDPVERGAWHIVWDKSLQCSELYSKLRELSEAEYKEYVETIPFENFEIRTERQTLIKLPKTGAVIFANHPVYLNISKDLADVPVVPSIILKMLHESPEKIIKYKHFDLLRDHLQKPLEKLIERQLELGLITKDTPIRTVPNFPFR